MGKLTRYISVFVLVFAFVFTSISPAEALVSVRGYYRKDGTYVRPHYRTDPDGIASNNFSYNGLSTVGMSYGTASYYEDYYRSYSAPKLSKREKKVVNCQNTGKSESYCKSLYMKKKHK